MQFIQETELLKHQIRIRIEIHRFHKIGTEERKLKVESQVSTEQTIWEVQLIELHQVLFHNLEE